MVHKVLEYLESKELQKREKYKRVLFFTVLLFFIVLIVGALLFQSLFDLDTIDAFYAAALVMTSIDVEPEVITTGQKLFVLIYALIVVIIFLSLANNAINYLVLLID